MPEDTFFSLCSKLLVLLGVQALLNELPLTSKLLSNPRYDSGIVSGAVIAKGAFVISRSTQYLPPQIAIEVLGRSLSELYASCVQLFKKKGTRGCAILRIQWLRVEHD